MSTTRLKPSTSGGGWRSCRREGPPFKIPHVQPVASYSGELRSRIYAVAGVIKRAHRTSEPRSPRNLVKGPAPPRALLFCSALFLPTSSGVTFHASRNPQRSPPNRGCLDNGEDASTRVGRVPMAPSRRRIAMGAVGGWTRPILPPTSGVPMHVTLTDEQHLMLEIIADTPLAAIPEIARYTNVLAAARLIELTPKAQWRITRLGQTMLAPRGYWVH